MARREVIVAIWGQKTHQDSEGVYMRGVVGALHGARFKRNCIRWNVFLFLFKIKLTSNYCQ